MPPDIFAMGILLAPVTALIVSQLLRGEPTFIPSKAFSPSRFRLTALVLQM